MMGQAIYIRHHWWSKASHKRNTISLSSIRQNPISVISFYSTKWDMKEPIHNHPTKGVAQSISSRSNGHVLAEVCMQWSAQIANFILLNRSSSSLSTRTPPKSPPTPVQSTLHPLSRLTLIWTSGSIIDHNIFTWFNPPAGPTVTYVTVLSIVKPGCLNFHCC